MTFLRFVRSDYCRYTGCRKAGIVTLVSKALFGRIPGYKYSFWLRLARYGNFLTRPLGIVMHHHYTIKYHIDIKRWCDIGYGLYLSHGMCIVINGATKIGNNVNISQFVNIGTNDPAYHATIGDNVYIGPLSSIVGGVTIGDNVTIGANSLVNKDIPENATAAGVPAHVLNNNNPARYILNRAGV